MRTNKFSIILTSTALLAFGSAAVQASNNSQANPTRQGPSKEQKIGMTTGTVIGAILGGPFGAGIGFIVGSMSGVGAQKVNDTRREAAALKTELATTQNALAEVQAAAQKMEQDKLAQEQQEKVAAAKAASEPTLDQVAQQLRADVMFRTASAELDTAAATKIAELGAVLGKYPNLKIDIDGYADPRGKAGENLELSQQRALAVRAALLTGGATSDSISIAAHGDQLSTAVKGDTEAYAWERRASLSVTTGAPSELAQVK